MLFFFFSFPLSFFFAEREHPPQVSFQREACEVLGYRKTSFFSFFPPADAFLSLFFFGSQRVIFVPLVPPFFSFPPLKDGLPCTFFFFPLPSL